MKTETFKTLIFASEEDQKHGIFAGIVYGGITSVSVPHLFVKEATMDDLQRLYGDGLDWSRVKLVSLRLQFRTL